MATFITGATGFLGIHLLRDFLREQREVIALVRPKQGRSGFDRLDLLLTLTGADDNVRARLQTHVRCVEGDIRAERFGLDPAEYRRLLEETDELWHCAASITLRGDSVAPWDCNVGGIHRVLEFVEASARPVKFFPVSTVYTSGTMRTGEFGEDFPATTEVFENAYEKSKQYTEKLIHDWWLRTGNPCVVFRTSILISDRSGVDDFPGHTLLAVARRLRALLMASPPDEAVRVRWPVDPLATINMVPVDYAVELMMAMAKTSEGTSLPRAIHIVNPSETSIHTMRMALEETCDVRIRAVPGYPARATHAEYRLYRLIGPFFPYFNHRRTYSTDGVKHASFALPKCPVVDQAYMIRSLSALRTSIPVSYGLEELKR
ncbi:SDR family oxidoreductase [Streptomyces virginiae]|uniref:SDR family oxidoreductase n=1 Tax=Streptomyces virginiae TaxID=1961 RepID=UPI0036D04E23